MVSSLRGMVLLLSGGYCVIVFVVILLVFSAFSSIEKHQAHDVIKNQKRDCGIPFSFLEISLLPPLFPLFLLLTHIGLLKCTGVHSKAPK